MKCQNPDCNNEIKGKAWLNGKVVCNKCYETETWKRKKDRYREKKQKARENTLKCKLKVLEKEDDN